MVLNNLKQTDDKVYSAVRKELVRQRNGVEMIASENFVSRAVLETMGTVLTNKYSEGLPAKRYYSGNEFIDESEQLAIDRAKKLFGADHANVQPHAGSQANMEAYFALLKLGDKVLGMDLSAGGHLTHGSPVNFSGKFYNFVSYGVDDDGFIDIDNVRKKAESEKPNLLLSGFSAYPRTLDFSEFEEIAKDVGAFHMADIAHIAGLVATGHHPSPVPHSDIVTTTTHKTLRGPRGAMIMCKEEHAKAIDKAVFPGMQGGPLDHIIAAKAVAFKEALQPDFKDYIGQVVKNAKILAETLMNNNVDLVTGGTDNHLMLIDLRKNNLSGKQIETALDDVHIFTNKNMVPNDPRKPWDPSGIRIGTPALTSRGMKEPDMKLVGELISQIINDPENEALKAKIKNQVLELAGKFPLYPDLEY